SQQVGADDGGGHLDHDADRHPHAVDPARVDVAPRLLEKCLHLAHLVNGGDHGEHQAERVRRRDPEGGPQLIEQQVRPAQERPSRVTAGAASARTGAGPRTARMASGGGSIRTVPWSPSSSTSCPSRTASTSPAIPTTAGRPRARARIAVCAVALPCSVAKPTTSARSSPAVCEGARSRATSTDGSDGGGGIPAVPWRARRTCS